MTKFEFSVLSTMLFVRNLVSISMNFNTFFNPTGVPFKRKICLTSSKAKDAIGTSIIVCVPKFVTVAARVYILVLLYRVPTKLGLCLTFWFSLFHLKLSHSFISKILTSYLHSLIIILEVNKLYYKYHHFVVSQVMKLLIILLLYNY